MSWGIAGAGRIRLAAAFIVICAICALGAARAEAAIETRTVPSEKVLEIKYDPATSSRCGEEVFVRWPIQTDATELRAKIFYFHLGDETYGTSTPPFDDVFSRGGASFPVPAGQHQYAMVGGSAEDLGGGTADCSGLRENSENWYAGPVRVELEVEVPDVVPTEPANSCSAGELKRKHRLQARIKTARKGKRKALKRRGRLKHRVKKLTAAKHHATAAEQAAAQMKLQHARQQLHQAAKQIHRDQKRITTMREKVADACR